VCCVALLPPRRTLLTSVNRVLVSRTSAPSPRPGGLAAASPVYALAAPGTITSCAARAGSSKRPARAPGVYLFAALTASTLRKAVRAAALAQARTAELLGAPASTSHHSASCSGRRQKQTGPALFAPGNSRAACAIPPAVWQTHSVPARPPTASARHLPSVPFQASLV
jgi:hypothetical protein